MIFFRGFTLKNLLSSSGLLPRGLPVDLAAGDLLVAMIARLQGQTIGPDLPPELFVIEGFKKFLDCFDVFKNAPKLAVDDDDFRAFGMVDEE